MNTYRHLLFPSRSAHNLIKTIQYYKHASLIAWHVIHQVWNLEDMCGYSYLVKRKLFTNVYCTCKQNKQKHGWEIYKKTRIEHANTQMSVS